MKPKIHLLCNAHLDPVWLWQWKEGAAEAVSTFRVAVNFCKKYDGFVFNHNEAVLYKWVEEYEPELFRKIQALVAAGKWKIMGGWYLQPDCTMLSGESFLNQIELGQEYFKEKFGVSFKTAINFDPFGHTRGLVQILAKCGYQNYIYMRPNEEALFDFKWVGFDGSEICAHNIFGGYNTLKGTARQKIEDYLNKYPEHKTGLILWGIGNHGGGPSEIDLNEINALIDERKDKAEIVHSDADSYFSGLNKQNLPVKKTSLCHTMVGCYTSQVRIKQAHRSLENKLMVTEKMMACAALQNGTEFDGAQMKRAKEDLAFSQFHDILPGSAIKQAEEDSLRLMSHAEETLDRLQAKAFFALCSGQKKPMDKQIPIMAFNPHPYAVEGNFEIEFMLENQNWNDGEQTVACVYDENGNALVCQNEKPSCTFHLDWIQKVSFRGTLAPSGITRFNCSLSVAKDYKMLSQPEENDAIVIDAGRLRVEISTKTGLIQTYQIDGSDMIAGETGVLEVFFDNEDPWGMTVSSFQDFAGVFSLISNEEAADFIGHREETLRNVRVIENGSLRTKIQAIFRYDKTYAVVEYTIPKHDIYLDVDITLFSANANKMIKYRIDTGHKLGTAYGQTAFGTQELENGGAEVTFHKWCGIKEGEGGLCAINRGIYGGSFENGAIKLSLLRTPVYSAHPILDREIAPKNRFLSHIDMGERHFSLRLAPFENIDAQAQCFNEQPQIMSLFPSGEGAPSASSILCSSKDVLVSSYKQTPDGFALHLFNTTEHEQDAEISIPSLGICETLHFGKFELKLLKTDGRKLCE